MNSSKTKKMVTGVISSIIALSITGCSDEALPPKPDNVSCSDWEWDDDLGVWRCDDSSSSHHGSYFHSGKSYKNKSSLIKSADYKSYSSSSSFKGGFGSGTKGGFGG